MTIIPRFVSFQSYLRDVDALTADLPPTALVASGEQGAYINNKV